MDSTILQVPMSKALKINATVVAKEQGFSSLQEVVRVLVNKLARKQLVVDVVEPEEVHLSRRAQKRYAQMEEDYKSGKNWRSFSSVDEFLRDLHS